MNVVHFLFKLFKQRHRLWRWQQSWILMSYCTCVRDMKQLNKKCIFTTLTHKSSVPGHQSWAKIKLKFPTEFKVHFYTQLVEYNFCWN